MKKTLVAMAALAVTGVYAQSGVTLTGNVDVGYAVTNVDLVPTSKFGGLASNNSSTTAFFFKGVEDLGGGLKASFTAELDWQPVQSNSANLNSTTSSLGGIPYTGTPFNGEQFIAVSGGFGEVKLGTPNSPALDMNAMSQPFGTALGGGFSSGFGRLGTSTVSGYNQYVGAEGSTGRIIRHEKTMVYTTPEVMPGLKAQIEYSAANSNGAYVSNDNGVLGTTLRYSQGPLNAAWMTTKVSSGSIAAAGTPAWTTLSGVTSGVASSSTISSYTANALATNASVTYNMAAANYTVGNTTIYGGFTTTKSDGITTNKVIEDSKSQNIAVKYVMGNVDLIANYLTRKSNLTEAQTLSVTTGTISNFTPTQKLLGLGANYNLSKNTMLYARVEKISGLNGGSSTATLASQGIAPVVSYGNATSTKSAVGIKMAF